MPSVDSFKSLTPLNDFIENYVNSDFSRFHMPGHKGNGIYNISVAQDITEIKGADYLFEASGIIGESERIASDIFQSAYTLYSAEGSSLSIKTMVALAAMNNQKQGLAPEIIAPRNCHKAFVDGCILSDVTPVWVFPKEKSYSICTSLVTAGEIEEAIHKSQNPCGVYITSPDYCGNIADIKGISEVCRKHGVPLLVDNAHGAYLKFTEPDIHPITLGADICCDSAHKTLPVLTGGGYLHISHSAPLFFKENAKNVMSLFASTSPSFLILASLDRCNGILADDFRKRVAVCSERLERCAETIREKGFEAVLNEPLKLTIHTTDCGYTGEETADFLRSEKIEPEYSDGECVVLMASPFNREQDFLRLEKAFRDIKPIRKRVLHIPLEFERPKVRLTPRQAAFSRFETIETDKAEGRICALTVTSCQPSIPVAVPGEEISDNIIKILKRYSIFQMNVLK